MYCISQCILEDKGSGSGHILRLEFSCHLWTWTNGGLSTLVESSGNSPRCPAILLTKLCSNLKFIQNTIVYIFFHICLITTTFCTYQDSCAVLVCAKFRCDQISLLEIIAMIIYFKFWIYGKKHQWKQPQLSVNRALRWPLLGVKFVAKGVSRPNWLNFPQIFSSPHNGNPRHVSDLLDSCFKLNLQAYKFWHPQRNLIVKSEFLKMWKKKKKKIHDKYIGWWCLCWIVSDEFECFVWKFRVNWSCIIVKLRGWGVGFVGWGENLQSYKK